jgi:hypothetical protein
MFSTLSFSATKNSITARCLCNMCQTQTPFTQTTTAVLSDNHVLIHMCAINISVATYQFSHCYLYSGMRKEMWGITFWATYVLTITHVDLPRWKDALFKITNNKQQGNCLGHTKICCVFIYNTCFSYTLFQINIQQVMFEVWSWKQNKE